MFRLSDIQGKYFASCGSALVMFGSLCSAQAASFTVLHDFNVARTGAYPQAGLIADSAGNFYGTTQKGGADNSGVVFRLAPDRTETVLHSFGPRPDGEYPVAGLMADAAGNLYGTTEYGGGGGCSVEGGPQGCGTVFEVGPNGTETILHSFHGGDGEYPLAGLIADAAGNLYGTTQNGGGNGTGGCFNGCGTVFKLAPDGTETVLYHFCQQKRCADGYYPLAGLIADTAGNLYGTTVYGGGQACGSCGTVFKLTPSGAETVLYAFTGDSSGYFPAGGLIADGAGDLYGTTEYGGATDCSLCGTVFKLTPTGGETVLYSFAFGGGTKPDGGFYPMAGLIADAAGNLYGTTQYGGNYNTICENGCGTIFRLATDGTETVLKRFCSVADCADGEYSMGGLVADAMGNLYGTTENGGATAIAGVASNQGIVFELKK